MSGGKRSEGKPGSRNGRAARAQIPDEREKPAFQRERRRKEGDHKGRPCKSNIVPGWSFCVLGTHTAGRFTNRPYKSKRRREGFFLRLSSPVSPH